MGVMTTLWRGTGKKVLWKGEGGALPPWVWCSIEGDRREREREKVNILTVEWEGPNMRHEVDSTVHPLKRYPPIPLSKRKFHSAYHDFPSPYLRLPAQHEPLIDVQSLQ
jgi:hypothetical protein